MRYLFGKDAEGKVRTPAPEILYGDVEITSTLIDMNQNKQKYSSGVISFRDGEKPTKKQMMEILNVFYENFAPGMGPNRVNLLALLHQDKGNYEVHIVIPRLDMKTMKSFNIAPPGKMHQQQQKDFSALWNDRLGYDQVIENPLKVVLNKFDYHAEKGQKRKAIKNKLSESLFRGVQQRKINNRDDLIKCLERTGAEITRSGKYYMSVKFKGQEKAIRLKGPAFAADADYQKLMTQERPKKLNSIQLAVVANRFNSAVQARRNFNSSRYAEKPRKYYSYTPISRIKSTVKAENKPQIKSAPKPIEIVQKPHKEVFSTTMPSRYGSTGRPTGNINPASTTTQKNRTSGVGSAQKSLGSLQMQIAAAKTDLANANTIEERIRAEQRLAELMFQENLLYAQLEEAKKADLNTDQQAPPVRRPRFK